MKKILASMKTVTVLLVLTVVFLAFFVYMIARPISYGMEYHNETVYDGEVFEGTMKFGSDYTMLNRNSNFDEEMQSRYYYKDGYIFFTLAETAESYAEEVAWIEANFDEAVDAPFYASEINAFRLTSEGQDGYTSVYTCMPAIVFTVVGGVIELALISLSVVSLVLYKKSKCNE